MPVCVPKKYDNVHTNISMYVGASEMGQKLLLKYDLFFL